MLFNDLITLDVLIFLITINYIISTNLIMLVYLGGLYLLTISMIMLIFDADIYTGFLLVIDLGVGLVFFIFILHFTSFLFQKSTINLSNRGYIYSPICIIMLIIITKYNSTSSTNNDIVDFCKNWFFKVTYLDYYNVLNTNEITELNLLFDSYFTLNSFEFFIINFTLLFGLLTSILLCFFIQRVFNILNYSQIINLDILKFVDSSFFIRNQNMITQTNTSGSTSIWVKSKN